MRKALAISSGSIVAMVSTHGLVYSGIQLDPSKPLPLSTYAGLFERILLSVWRAWNALHGWQPMSHADEFGRFLALATFLLCPLLGFLAFWLASRLTLPGTWWKPLAIAIAFATPLQLVLSGAFRSIGMDTAQAEAARALVVFLLMAWSIGAIGFPKREPSDSRHLATPSPRPAS